MDILRLNVTQNSPLQLYGISERTTLFEYKCTPHEVDAMDRLRVEYIMGTLSGLCTVLEHFVKDGCLFSRLLESAYTPYTNQLIKTGF